MIGRNVSHYKIVDKLGEGGMGEVYLADDTSLDRKVALKFLPERLQQDSTARKRFLREAKSAAALDHPFICKVYQVGEEEDVSFIAMEYVKGYTLKDRLADGPLPLKEGIRTASEIAEALEKAHQEGIIHRDLKPSNIMITPEGHVKVMDFGLAKQVMAPERDKGEDLTTSLTHEGLTPGTVAYMSPEQLRGEPLDARSDLFSFGIILYEMLSGVHPFKRDIQVATAAAILAEEHPPITHYVANAPQDLLHVIESILSKTQEERYHPTSELLFDLSTLLEDISSKKLIGRNTSISVVFAILILSATAIITNGSKGALPIATSRIFLGTAGLFETAPAWNPTQDIIAYSDGDIWICDLEGDSRQNLTSSYIGDLVCWSLEWSPNGRTLAFLGDILEASNTYALYYLTVPEGNPNKITDIFDDRVWPYGAIDWVPDGNHLVYHDTNPSTGRSEIFSVSIDGSNKTCLTDEIPGSKLHPAISPSGDLLSFYVRHSMSQNVYILNLNSGEIDSVSSEARNPIWHPSGKRLFYQVLHRPGTPSIYSVDVNPRTGHLKNESQLRFSAHNAHIYDSSFNSDGDGLILGVMSYYPSLWHYTIDSVTGSASQLGSRLTTRETISESPNWIRDSDMVIFSASQQGTRGIWRMKYSNPIPERLTTQDEEAYYPVVSPNGEWIIYADFDNNSLNIISSDGSEGHVLYSGPRRHIRTLIASDWSHDGHRIAVTAISIEGEYDLGIIALDKRYGEFQGITWLGISGSNPVWSPDDSRLAYNVDGEYRSLGIVCLADGTIQQYPFIPSAALDEWLDSPSYIYHGMWRTPVDPYGKPTGTTVKWFEVPEQVVFGEGTSIGINGAIVNLMEAEADLWLLEFQEK